MEAKKWLGKTLNGAGPPTDNQWYAAMISMLGSSTSVNVVRKDDLNLFHLSLARFRDHNAAIPQ